MDSSDALTAEQLSAITRSRRRLVSSRVVSTVSVGEDLIAVLDSEIGATMQDLLSSLAALVSMTSPAQSPTGDGRSPNVGDHIPSFHPAWASRHLDQVGRQLDELAGAVEGWCHRPYDPHARKGTCIRCSGHLGREDQHCRTCGEPTLRHYRRTNDSV